MSFRKSGFRSNITMQYHINIFRHHEITLFPPSQLDSAAEILLRHLCKYHSKQVKLIVNVLTGLIMISDYNCNDFSNISADCNFSQHFQHILLILKELCFNTISVTAWLMNVSLLFSCYCIPKAPKRVLLALPMISASFCFR